MGGVEEAKRCCVCQLVPAAKYKCPTCFAPYCSVPCCKKHKEVPCQKPAASVPGDSTQLQGNASASALAAVRPPEQSASEPSISDLRPQPKRPFEEPNNEDEAQWRLKREHFEAIAGDEKLRLLLRNHELQRLLLVVDASNNPKVALEQALGVPAFKELVSQLERHLPASAQIRGEEGLYG